MKTFLPYAGFLVLICILVCPSFIPQKKNINTVNLDGIIVVLSKISNISDVKPDGHTSGYKFTVAFNGSNVTVSNDNVQTLRITRREVVSYLENYYANK